MTRMFSLARRYAGLVGLGTVATVLLVAASVAPASAHGMVDSGRITNQTIQSVDIGAGEVGRSEIRHGNVGAPQIEDQSIRSWDISAEGVGTSEIRDESVQREDLGFEPEQGEQGPPGEDGQDGVSGLVIPTDTFTVPANSGRSWYAVACPGDTFVIGGGWRAHQGAGHVVVTADKPNWNPAGPRESDDPNRAPGWNVGAFNDADADGEVTIWAMCAQVN